MVDRLSKWVDFALSGKPQDAGMRDLTRRHAEWFATARTGVRYYGANAFYEWTDTNPARLLCTYTVVFDDAGRDRLYTPNGSNSLALFNTWGGLTTTEPPRPAPPRGVRIEGRLQDWANPELWQIKEMH